MCRKHLAHPRPTLALEGQLAGQVPAEVPLLGVAPASDGCVVVVEPETG